MPQTMAPAHHLVLVEGDQATQLQGAQRIEARSGCQPPVGAMGCQGRHLRILLPPGCKACLRLVCITPHGECLRLREHVGHQDGC